MKLTAYDIGQRHPADHFPPETRAKVLREAAKKTKRPFGHAVVSPEERERRIRLLNRAITRAGTIRALARALPADETQVGRWAKGRNAIQDQPLSRILAYLGEDAA
ncbi:MAG: hypothetical protein R3215_11115 [Halomonas sp.]|nr:hypothetical protein [Halomonas sp.]